MDSIFLLGTQGDILPRCKLNPHIKTISKFSKRNVLGSFSCGVGKGRKTIPLSKTLSKTGFTNLSLLAASGFIVIMLMMGDILFLQRESKYLFNLQRLMSARQFLLMLLLMSCAGYPVPGRMKKRLYCYTGDYTGLDKMISIQGYYSSTSSGVGNFLFYDDGIFICGLGTIEYPVDSLLSAMVANGRDFHTRTYKQGSYQIAGDTIIARYINSGLANTWTVYESHFLILDRNTLKELDWHVVGEKPSPFISFTPGRISNFFPLQDIPKSSSWLKDKEWFYCNNPMQKSK